MKKNKITQLLKSQNWGKKKPPNYDWLGVMVIIWKFWKIFLPAAMPEIWKKSSTTLPSLFSMIPNYKNTIIFYCQKKMTKKINYYDYY
jgi:hypothetical protein